LEFIAKKACSGCGIKVRVSSQYVCGGRLGIDATEIKSPNYPAIYDTDTVCVWNLQRMEGKQVQLNCPEFNLDESSKLKDLSHIPLTSYTGQQEVTLTSKVDSSLTFLFYTGETQPSDGKNYRFRCDIKYI